MREPKKKIAKTTRKKNDFNQKRKTQILRKITRIAKKKTKSGKKIPRA